MSENKLKATITLVNKPIIKKISPFVGGKSNVPKKMIAQNDASIRR
ncbi:MAG: hypothetical protein U9Q20_05225 [Campylobacterota bacterium]|nr:hypothetical protein [Campylobacterota bacterium]